MLSDLLYRLRALARRNAVEAELDDELRFHIEKQAEKYHDAGMPVAEAARRARLDFGGPDQVREECRDARGTRWIEDSAQDFRYALRTLRKNPVFAAAAMITIALGIGASATVFTVMNAVLLQPLPYNQPERLLLVNPLLSNALFHDLRDATSGSFEDMGAMMVYRAIVPREDGSTERISKAQITTNFFRMMGARIAFGRDFTDADAQPPAEPEPIFPPPEGKVAILSYEYFQSRYGANPAVLGSFMLGTAGPGPQIVGVLAPGFKLYLPERFTTEPSPDVWIANNRGYDAPHRGHLMLRVIGRTRDGVSLEQAQAEVDTAALNRPQGPAFEFKPRLQSWHAVLVEEVRPAILALMGAVIFLLLIACANVANLLLLRTPSNQRELAVRAALGARQGRLTRQIVAEAGVLCGFGTVLGIASAWPVVGRIPAIIPANVPRLETIAMDWRVLGFAALAGLTQVAVFGMIPGWRAARPDVMRILRGGGRSAGPASSRLLRNAVVVAEVALSFVLLVGAGLMFRSFLELRRVDPGYDSRGLLTFLLIGDARGFQPDERLAFLREIKQTLGAIPGVESVGASLALPLVPVRLSSGIQWGTEADPDPLQMADLPVVLPGYFETLRTRRVEGRTFTEQDNQPGRNVAIVDQLLADKAFPGQSAVGKRIFVNVPTPLWLDVIGVVAHQRLDSLADPGREQIYLTDGFFGIGISRHWALRTSGDPGTYAAAVRAEITGLAPGRLAVTKMETMETIVDRAQAGTRFHLLLVGLFGVIATLLAGVGLYGVLSGAVRQRTTEIGVRIAFGAQPGSIFGLVIGRGLLLTSIGLVLGLIAAFSLTRVMTTMLVGVRPTDPLTFAAMAVAFLLIAGVASWGPARRAASLDPMTVLRDE